MALNQGNRLVSLSIAGGAFSNRLVELNCILCAGCIFAGSVVGASQESPASRLPENPGIAIATNTLQMESAKELLGAMQRLQEQLRSNQLSMQENTLQAGVAGVRSAEALSNGLRSLERAFSAQQEVLSSRSAQQFEAMRSSNVLIVGLAGVLAGVGIVTLLTIAYMQWRMSRLWTENWRTQPVPNLGTPPAAALPEGEPNPEWGRRVADSNGQLLGTVERLERRVHQLERGLGSSLSLKLPASAHAIEGNGGSCTSSAQDFSEERDVNKEEKISALMRQGQARLKENDLQVALKCFDEVLLLKDDQGDAWVRKGATLERMQKLNEAFECYDRAIKVGRPKALAYLHKGGLCSRLERFKEALDCYEAALRTHDEEVV